MTPMQVGTRAFIDAQITRMARLSDSAARLQGNIATGKRLAAPSDDPVAGQKLALVDRRQSDGAQYALGLDTAEMRLSIADRAVDNLANQMIHARELALLASNDTNSPENRRTIAGELREVVRTMVSLANAQDGSGTYLFSGARASTPAFVFNASGVVEYQGLARATPVEIGPNARIEAAEPGVEVLGGVDTATGKRSVFAILEDLLTALDAPEPASEDTAAIEARREAFATAVEDIGSGITHLATVRSSFGGRLNRIESERDRMTAIDENLTLARSKLEDTDLASAITELQYTSLVLQASQASFARLSQLSLFDQLR